MFYRYQKGYLEAVILGKNKQYNGKGKRKKDKPSLTKHYTENKRLSNMNSTKN